MAAVIEEKAVRGLREIALLGFVVIALFCRRNNSKHKTQPPDITKPACSMDSFFSKKQIALPQNNQPFYLG
jgi:hypothetical protein